MITMSTLQNKLQRLIAKANAHTNKKDADLTDAIDSLIEMKTGEIIESGVQVERDDEISSQLNIF